MTYESNTKWVLPSDDGLSQDLNYPDDWQSLAYLLHKRGIGSDDLKEELELGFDDMPDPTSLFGVEDAKSKILDAIKNDRKIVIHGDFDADGISATALVWEFLYKELAGFYDKDVDVTPYIPSREDEGYGLSDTSIKAMIDLEADLVITVDCGIRDKELIHKYSEKHELEFIVTDHHQPPEDIKDNLDYSIVHQKFPDSEFKYPEISGTAVVFLLVEAIRKELYEDYELTADSNGLDLVAISTVCDMMPLTQINRTWLKAGMEQMRKINRREGINQLMGYAKINPAELESYHLGFQIGPRLNATGRIGDALDGVRLMVLEDEKKAAKFASKLSSLNSQRQQITKHALDAASDVFNEDEKMIFHNTEDLEEGIIGLVAGKLNERFYRPVIVTTARGDSIKGSCRSIKGFNITDALSEFSDYLEKFGGHELAAGFTAKTETFDEFNEKFIEYVNQEIDVETLVPTLEIDLKISQSEISKSFYNEVNKLKPFGYGNPKPKVMVQQCVICKKQTMGRDKSHMKLALKSDGIGTFDAILFNCEEDIKKLQVDDVIDIVGDIDINEWNNVEYIQFKIKEWKRSKL